MGDPDVVLHADRGAAGSRTFRGARTVARQALAYGSRGAAHARMALVNGAAGAVLASADRRLAVAGFTVAHGKIVEIDIVADPERLRALYPSVLED